MQLEIFVAADDVAIEHTRELDGTLSIITNHYAPLGKGAQIGDRPLYESKQDADLVDARFPKSNTHSRLGPWVVCSEGERFRGTGADYCEVAIFKCAYDPLPEEDNPWVPVTRYAPKTDTA